MIPHNRPTLGSEEEQAALKVIRSGFLSQGPEVESFENEFCNFMGLPIGHAVAVSNGTAALFLSLWALNAQNKQIVFPGYVCAALRHAVNMINGHEKLVDINSDSPNISLNKLKNTNSDIAIIPHMYGIPIDLTDMKHEKIIEDCAQALGAKVKGENVGLQGILGIFSFYATKIITSGGEGGMIVSKDKNLINSIKDYREFDFRHDDKKRFNFQMTDLQASIGREQLKKLPYFIQRREEIFNKYKNSCSYEFLDIDPKYSDTIQPVRYRAIIKTKIPKKIISSLESIGVHAIIPTEDWEILGDNKLFPNSLKLTHETVSLPIYPSLTDEEVEIIITELNKIP